MSAPVFVVLEGLDGTGKSTLARTLAERLSAVSLRTPGVELAPVRAAVDEALAPSALATQLFYAGTVALASDKARAALAQGRSVVCDRYWLSTRAYAGCREAHISLAALEPKLLRPDLTVYLTVDETVRAARLEARGATLADQASLLQRRKLARSYERLLRCSPLAGPVLRLETNLDADELAARVLGALALAGGGVMGTMPSYLRVVVTTRCNYRCGFCHMEGDPHAAGTAAELPREALVARLTTALWAGVKKVKFLGGEPLLRGDLPEILAAAREVSPTADLSVITAGAVPVRALDRAYEAGLSRVNVSLHGFGPAALAKNLRARGGHAQREEFLAAALEHARRRGVPLKVNYVLGEAYDRDDLAALLAWAATRPVTVGVLDDLGEELAWQTLAERCVSLRGAASEVAIDRDPHSLPTQVWRWSDGLRVEFKDHRLGEVAPYVGCGRCPQRGRCKEGITALRLTHRGLFQPCMDRPDTAFDLGPYLGARGDRAAALVLRAWAESL